MADSTSDEGEYGLSKIPEVAEVAAPDLEYLPPMPKKYRPTIGLIGAGGITEYHLRAYQKMGLEVVEICDVDLEKAKQRQTEFYPEAAVSTDYRDILRRDDIDVVDVATHPEERVEIIREAIAAKKHILSQKPFVVDLDVGRELVDLADANDVKLAVNQNGRWAPHFRYMARAIEEGVIGELASIDFVMQWDHTWTAGTPFEKIHHLLLYDFAIHWFDMTIAMLGPCEPKTIYAAVSRTSFQSMKPPMIAQVCIDCEQVQVRMNLNAHVVYGQEDRTIVSGSRGTMRALGPGLNDQQVQIWNESGHSRPSLKGDWFDNGFRGTMGELLCAIEEDRTPWNNANDNLRSLKLCFAAMKSADSLQVVQV